MFPVLPIMYLLWLRDLCTARLNESILPAAARALGRMAPADL